MQFFGNIFTLIVGFGTIGFIAIRNKLRLHLNDLILILITFTILLPPIRISNSLPAIRFEELIYYLFFFTAIILIIINKKLIINNFLVYILLYIIGSMFLSAIYSQLILGIGFTINDSFEFVKVIKYLVILLLLSNLSYQETFIKQFIIIIILSITISAIIGILQYLNLFNINSQITPLYTISQLGNIDNRIIGTTANPNDFGIFLISGIILTQNQLIVNRNKTLLYFLAIIIMLFAVIMTVSRTTLLTLVIAELIFLFLLIHRHNFPKKVLILFTMFFFVVGIFIIKYTSDYFITRISSGMNIGEDVSFLLRLISWEKNINIWLKSPIFGWGPAKSIQSTIVDNEYILILRRYGIVGILGYLTFYLFPLYEMFRINFNKLLDCEKILINSMLVMLIIFLFFNITIVTFKNIQLMDLWMIMISIFYSIKYTKTIEIQNV